MRLVDIYISSLDAWESTMHSLSLSLSLCARNRDPEIRQRRKRDSGGRTPRRELLYDFWANDLKQRIISERRHRLEFCAKQICNYPGEIETCVEEHRIQFTIDTIGIEICILNVAGGIEI